MSLSDKEKMLLEAFRNALDDKALGFLPKDKQTKETSHYLNFKYEDINDMMYIKINTSPFADAVMAAFKNTHSYKYVTDPTFVMAFTKNMKAMGIPGTDQEKGVDSVIAIVKSLHKDGYKAEADYGWNPHMDEIVDVTTNADDRKAKNDIPFGNKESLRATEIDAKYDKS